MWRPRLCKNAVLFQFQGSSYPSEAKNNRIQSVLRGRYLTARLRDEFLHSLGQEQPCRKVAESGRSLALSTHYSRSSVDFASLFLAKEKAWTASSGETS